MPLTLPTLGGFTIVGSDLGLGCMKVSICMLVDVAGCGECFICILGLLSTMVWAGTDAGEKQGLGMGTETEDGPCKTSGLISSADVVGVASGVVEAGGSCLTLRAFRAVDGMP